MENINIINNNVNINIENKDNTDNTKSVFDKLNIFWKNIFSIKNRKDTPESTARLLIEMST